MDDVFVGKLYVCGNSYTIERLIVYGSLRFWIYIRSLPLHNNGYESWGTIEFCLRIFIIFPLLIRLRTHFGRKNNNLSLAIGVSGGDLTHFYVRYILF